MLLGYGPDPTIAPWVFALAVLVTFGAFVTDAKTGHIPNWLSLPPIAIGLLLAGFVSGLDGLLGALIAVVVVGFVPALLFVFKGMGMGDLKLFAALGALLGVELGLEAEFLAFVVGCFYALGRLGWDGKLLGTLRNTIFVAANPVLPTRLRRELPPEMLHKLRFGGAIFGGTMIALFTPLQLLLGIAVLGRT